MVNIHLGFGRQRIAAIVDIAPGGARVAIISVRKGQRSSVLALGRSALALEQRTEEQARSMISSQIEEASDQAFRAYSEAGLVDPISDVYIFVHAPWSRTAMISGEHVYDGEFRVEAPHIAEIVKESMSSSKDITPKNIIEGSVIRVYLNGYPTKDPEGKDAHRIRALAIASELDPVLRKNIEGAVHRKFPVGRSSWRTSLRAYMRAAHEIMQKESYVVVDMGVDDTHIAAVHDGTMDQLVVPEGVRTILARISGGRSAEEVLGYMRMLSRDACSSESCEAVKQAIATMEPELVRVFGEAMAKIGATNKIPNDVLLITHRDLEPWFAVFLARIDFAQFSLTAMPLSVHSATTLDTSAWIRGLESADLPVFETILVNIESNE